MRDVSEAKLSVHSLMVVIYFLANFSAADCSCSDELKTTCLNAASSDSLRDLSGGGTCIAKQYVHFTHICTVNNYLPNVDYCCCTLNDDIMCCLYHQDWDFFRCLQSNDTILSASSFVMPPMEILLPAVLVPVLVIVFFVVCFARRCCYDNDDDENSVPDSWALVCCRCYSSCGYELATEADAKPAAFVNHKNQLNDPISLYSRNINCLADDQNVTTSHTQTMQWPAPGDPSPTHIWLVHPTTTRHSTSHAGCPCRLQYLLPASESTSIRLDRPFILPKKTLTESQGANCHPNAMPQPETVHLCLGNIHEHGCCGSGSSPPKYDDLCHAHVRSTSSIAKGC